MKTIRLKDNIVVEIVPEYALPVEKWYGKDFAAQCVEAPDDVQQGMVYDEGNDTFSQPELTTPSLEPDALTQTQLALAELAETEAAHDLENKLALAELADMIGGTSNG